MPAFPQGLKEISWLLKGESFSLSLIKETVGLPLTYDCGAGQLVKVNASLPAPSVPAHTAPPQLTCSLSPVVM